jgi:hypothetical protein
MWDLPPKCWDIRRQRASVPNLGLRRRLYLGVQQRPANILKPLVTPLAERIKHRQRYVGPNAKCARMRNSRLSFKEQPAIRAL